MKKKLALLSVIILFIGIVLSCENETKRPLNPNGDSELAILMRAMFDEGMIMKEGITKGILPRESMTVNHGEIMTAEATDPDQVDNADFRAYAGAYLGIINAMRKTNSRVEALGLYDSMVESCKSCHEALCPGPLVRIAKLKRGHGFHK